MQSSHSAGPFRSSEQTLATRRSQRTRTVRGMDSRQPQQRTLPLNLSAVPEANGNERLIPICLRSQTLDAAKDVEVMFKLAAWSTSLDPPTRSAARGEDSSQPEGQQRTRPKSWRSDLGKRVDPALTQQRGARHWERKDQKL